MVDRKTVEPFGDRFERLRGGMSYQALSEGIKRKTGVSITAQALNKWSHGGNVDPENLRAAAQFFGVNEAWLMYGTGPESNLSLNDVVNALPAQEAAKTLDFIKYQIERSATETALFAEDPAKLAEYLKMIDRLITDRRSKDK